MKIILHIVVKYLTYDKLSYTINLKSSRQFSNNDKRITTEEKTYDNMQKLQILQNSLHTRRIFVYAHKIRLLQ